MTIKLCLQTTKIGGTGVTYSKHLEQGEMLAEWISIQTEVDYTIDDSYDFDKSITVVIEFALGGAIADGLDVHVKSHAYITIFPDWMDRLRTWPTPLWADVPVDMMPDADDEKEI